jgi:DNA-binding NtrC family response regulator
VGNSWKIFAADSLSGTIIAADDIPEDAMSGKTLTPPENAANNPEARWILDVLQSTRWNKTRAAQVLGISPQTLYRLQNQGVIKTLHTSRFLVYIMV